MDVKGKTQICTPPVLDDESSQDGIEPRPSYLIVVDGGMPGTMYQVGESGASLGRSADNSIQLSVPTISRRHAFFSVDMNRNVSLIDLDSTNGSYLNGQRLEPHAPVWLRNGDRIRIGKSILLKYVKLDAQDERFQRELFERMVRDSLTGLFNRGYFLEQVEPLEGKCAHSGLGLAVILVDVDHFKTINDSYGHDAGDLVLREVARLLRESTRPDDLVARYGGEEFVIALPVDAIELAYERAERIRRQINEREVSFGANNLRISVSMGIAYRPPCRTWSPISLITDADEALYEAKRSGRNRIVLRSKDLQAIATITRSCETSPGPLSPLT